MLDFRGVTMLCLRAALSSLGDEADFPFSIRGDLAGRNFSSLGDNALGCLSLRGDTTGTADLLSTNDGELVDSSKSEAAICNLGMEGWGFCGGPDDNLACWGAGR